MDSEKETDGSSLLLSRRGFLYGAAGLCAVAAVGGGALACNALNQDGGEEIDYLRVPKDWMTPLADLEALDSEEGSITLQTSFDVPFGTLLWVNDPAVAACLLPTETGSPLAQIGILYLGSGMLQTVREEAVGKSDSFEIYDVRASSAGAIWTEADIMGGQWRIYGAPLQNGVLGTPVLLDEGDSTFETPTIAVAADQALWQKIPRSSTDLENPSSLMASTFTGENSHCLYESQRRNATPLFSDGEAVVITPRLDSSTVYHRLTRIDVASGEVTDTLILPASMVPMEAAFGPTGFMFSFPDIYSYGDGISNLGTYVPFELPPDGDYSAVPWFDFARTPSAAPTWAGDLLIVKSTYSVCGVDLSAGTYFAIDVENGADNWGEYLVSTNPGDSFVTYTNIDHTPVGEKTIHTGRVKVWKRDQSSVVS